MGLVEQNVWCPAKEQLLNTAGTISLLGSDADAALTPVSQPLDVAWQGDTSDRQSFATQLSAYQSDIKAAQQAALDSVNAAADSEPQYDVTWVEVPDAPSKPTAVPAPGR